MGGSRWTIGAVVLALCATPLGHAKAQESQSSVQLGGKYLLDTFYVAEGANGGEVFLLHDAEVTADLNLEALLGAAGLTAGVHLLATAGGRPNDAAGTLQGIDNIEVGSHRVKLYQAWLEQSFAGDRASLRIGLTDLNADFYQNDSAGLLVAPAFGIGSELASTGPNGPSIFPSTALTARISVRMGATGYARAAIVNAKSGVVGDPEGIDLAMRDGALLIAEAGSTAMGKLAVGAWRYTKRQDDVQAVGGDGTPIKRIANGVYLLADQKVAGTEGRAINLFVRAGLSEGRTTPFRGGFQAGMLVEAPLSTRPDGAFSFGIQQGVLSRGFKRALLDEGFQVGAAEWGLEWTYSDKLAPFLMVQPDVQYVRRAYSDGRTRATIAFGMRLTFIHGD